MSKNALILMDCRVIPDQVGDRPPAMMKLVRERNQCMRLKSVRPICGLLLAALSLAACASRNEPPPYAAVAPVEDDDAFCRAGGKVAVGSPDYVYCRKDRDAARNAAVARADRKQRDLAEYMMNHPDHP
jgi:hypothetical protein